MNIYANLKGCFAVLLGKLGWEDFFELNRDGVFKSFFGLVLILPSFYLVAYVLQSKKNSEKYDSLFEVLPFTSITVILFLYLLSFSAMALIVAMVFDFQDRLQALVNNSSLVHCMAVYFCRGSFLFSQSWINSILFNKLYCFNGIFNNTNSRYLFSKKCTLFKKWNCNFNWLWY